MNKSCFALLLLLPLSGCSSRPAPFMYGASPVSAIVGTWHGEYTAAAAPNFSEDTTLVFNTDNTGSQTTTTPFGMTTYEFTSDAAHSSTPTTVTITAIFPKTNGSPPPLFASLKNYATETYTCAFDGNRLTLENKSTGTKMVLTRS